MENNAQGSHQSNSTISPAADGILNKASSSAHTSVNSIASAAEEAARKAKPAIDQVAAMAHNAVDQAVSAAAPASNWLTEQVGNMNERQKKLVADTSASISANPLKSICLAVAAGYVLSRVMRHD
ncbi:ElaB/YqjD/DUF883 family membrane-anchored ribosome-binding protein [Oxalobacteraceae bacterium GrIS 2.11]